MEYFVYITKACNLKCIYCSGKEIERGKAFSNQLPNLEHLVKKIKFDMSVHGHNKNRIMFYGGEPLLNQQDIKKFMKLMGNEKKIYYCLYTNGTLLDRIDQSILKNLKLIFVSIDGVESVHDKYRGYGTYRKIVNNIKEIRSRFQGEVVANLTITTDSSVFEAVTSVVDLVDHVTWNIVNEHNLTFSYESYNVFLSNYKTDIEKLVDYWIKNIERGEVKNLIPFQAVSTSLISGKSRSNFWCGCGTTLRIVDINGDFYLCDELMDRPQYKIIEGTKLDAKKWSYSTLSEECRKCEVSGICAGRCLYTLLYYPPELRRKLCQSTKILIETLKPHIPFLKKSLDQHVIRWEQLRNSIILDDYPPEVIP